MDGPPPPRDVSLRNIIDKLAEFVARNGPEFEMITKQKQQNNPKFEFLYGGEHAAYYQCRVMAEQNFLKQQQQCNSGNNMLNQQQPPPHFTQGPPPNMMHHSDNQLSNNHDTNPFAMNQPPPNHQMWNSNISQSNAVVVPAAPTNTNNSLAINITAQIEAINVQQNSLREQIRQSESNLTAQHTALMGQQKKQIEEAIEAAQNAQLEKQAEVRNISLKEMDAVLQPIIDSCTKDSISAGKNWILQHSSDSAKNNVVLQYLLKKYASAI
uniref:SURP motif domain-containing protein n=1 Tax=Glossina palpalis gambiensis TaxID=67801 RepID=A0A1B0B7T4_9MUSC